MHIGNSQYSVVVSHTLVPVSCLPQTRIPCISRTLSTLLLYPTHWYLSHVYHKLEYRAYRELSVLCCCIPHTGTCRMFKSGTLSVVVVSHTLVPVACLPQTRIPCISGTLSTLLLYPTHWYMSHVYHKLEYRAYRELSVLCCCIPHTGTCRMFKSGTLSTVVVSHTLVHVACLPQTRIPCISGTLSTLLLYPTHWYMSHVYHKLEYRAYRELSVLCCCIPHTGTCRMFTTN